MELRNVGQLREALRDSEDDEPLFFVLEEEPSQQLKCVGVGSSGGGRITVIRLVNQLES